MKIQIINSVPDTAALASWASANHLGDVMSIRLPVTVDFDARTIQFRRAHGTSATAEDHPESHQLLVDLPEVIMSKVGPHESGLAYPVVMV